MVGEGESKVTTPPETPGGVAIPAEPEPFALDGLILLTDGSHAPQPVDGIRLTFDDRGVGVVHSPDEPPRLLPWSSLIAHSVEPWTGGVTPEWWVDPEFNRTGEGIGDDHDVIDPVATERSSSLTRAGALISLRTVLATYRFLLPSGNVDELRPRVGVFALHHQGRSDSSSTATVFAGRSPGMGRPSPGLTWMRVRPALIVVLVCFLLTAAILIVLQSAGTVHIPFLGGANSGTVESGGLRIR
ncbi:MAG TPA: hypothetical protein VGG43_15100 [Acidimicrobiales bacterium]|jgi:hypothetical protein